MYKQQLLHDFLIKGKPDERLVHPDQLSVYADEGVIDWQFLPERQGYTLTYQSNILVTEYSKKPHVLFLCVVSALAEFDPNPDNPHDIKWESGLLNKEVTDVEIKLNFTEHYDFRDVEGDEDADAFIDGQPVIFVPEDVPPLGDFVRFALIMQHDHDL